MRLLSCWLVFVALAGAQVSVSVGVRPQYDRVQGQIQDLRRMAVPGANPAQLNGAVNGLMGGFQGFYPMAGQFQQGDHEANRQLIRDAMAALAMVEAVAGADPALRGSLSSAYGGLGDYQARPQFQNQGYNPVGSYGRASGLARGLALNDRNYDRNLERYAMSMATWNATNGYIWAGMNNRQRERRDEEPMVQVPPPPDRKPIPVPDIDAAALNDQDKAVWEELRPQFVSVSSKVTEALRNLDSLSQRLRARQMDVNTTDLATSYRMQGFLEDAAALIQKKDLANGKLALDRAEYERRKMRSVVGQ